MDREQKKKNWSGCPKYDECKDDKKVIMTYCDIGCSAKPVPEQTDKREVVAKKICWLEHTGHNQMDKTYNPDIDELWKQHCYYYEHYLAVASSIISLSHTELKVLSDEEIKDAIANEVEKSKHSKYRVPITVTPRDRLMSQATVDKNRGVE